MRRIPFRSQNEWDCGYCAIGIACRVPRKRIEALDPVDAPRGLSIAEMAALVERLGFRPNLKKYWSTRPALEEFFVTPAPAHIVLIRAEDRSYGHWIFIEEGWIYDSDAPGPVGMEEYRRQGRAQWKVLVTLRPIS